MADALNVKSPILGGKAPTEKLKKESLLTSYLIAAEMSEVQTPKCLQKSKQRMIKTSGKDNFKLSQKGG